MKVYLGIDLGSTTSKAVMVDENCRIVGRGITNTRSDYLVAANIAQLEAEFNSRFTLLHRRLKETSQNGTNWDLLMPHLENRFHYLQFIIRFEQLVETMTTNVKTVTDLSVRRQISEMLPSVTDQVKRVTEKLFLNGEVSGTSQFFRDLFNSAYTDVIKDYEVALFDQMMALYDRSITPVENKKISFDFTDLIEQALGLLPDEFSGSLTSITKHLKSVTAVDFKPDDYVGTGYGRQLLPFEDKHIRSEILCHAAGAHAFFKGTRTVLDIGGQDTKAIQVDQNGLVTSFQMNDRCAAGCGRYLGYIADEMNMSVGELGPLALKATYATNICSTCTVFAGAELREQLNLGEKKENILAGLHRAIVLRAFSLLARSGGVRNEFTFTGGVARNPAIVDNVARMVKENYGDITINCHHDSIFMGALGASLFAARRKS